MRLLCRYVTYVWSHLCPLFAKYNVSVPLEERVQDEPANFTKGQVIPAKTEVILFCEKAFRLLFFFYQCCCCSALKCSKVRIDISRCAYNENQLVRQKEGNERKRREAEGRGVIRPAIFFLSPLLDPYRVKKDDLKRQRRPIPDNDTTDRTPTPYRCVKEAKTTKNNANFKQSLNIYYIFFCGMLRWTDVLISDFHKRNAHI